MLYHIEKFKHKYKTLKSVITHVPEMLSSYLHCTTC